MQIGILTYMIVCTYECTVMNMWAWNFLLISMGLDGSSFSRNFSSECMKERHNRKTIIFFILHFSSQNIYVHLSLVHFDAIQILIKEWLPVGQACSDFSEQEAFSNCNFFLFHIMVQLLSQNFKIRTLETMNSISSLLFLAHFHFPRKITGFRI